MSAVVPSSSRVYSQSRSGYEENVEIPVIQTRAPTNQDVKYPIGKRWINTVSNNVYTLMSFSYSNLTKTANWGLLTPGGINITAAGTTPALSGSVLVITNATVGTSSIILICRKAASGSIGPYTVTTSAGSFSINPVNAGDTSTLYYAVVN